MVLATIAFRLAHALYYFYIMIRSNPYRTSATTTAKNSITKVSPAEFMRLIKLMSYPGICKGTQEFSRRQEDLPTFQGRHTRVACLGQSHPASRDRGSRSPNSPLTILWPCHFKTHYAPRVLPIMHGPSSFDTTSSNAIPCWVPSKPVVPQDNAQQASNVHQDESTDDENV